MTTDEGLETTLPPNDEQEVRDVPRIKCDKCGRSAELRLTTSQSWPGAPELELRGVVTCSGDGHQWPLAIRTDNLILSTEQMMPVLESGSLGQSVPPGIVQDIKEAERAHFAQLYKASVVMCRRACQLGLAEPPHSIPDGPFSKMIAEAQARTPPPLSPRGFIHLEGVKEYGDVGAHKVEDVAAGHARTTISSAVAVLNELFP